MHVILIWAILGGLMFFDTLNVKSSQYLFSGMSLLLQTSSVNRVLVLFDISAELLNVLTSWFHLVRQSFKWLSQGFGILMTYF